MALMVSSYFVYLSKAFWKLIFEISGSKSDDCRESLSAFSSSSPHFVALEMEINDGCNYHSYSLDLNELAAEEKLLWSQFDDRNCLIVKINHAKRIGG